VQKITIKDVARIAKVHPATVSRVMSNDPRISEETKEKVNKIIKKYKFTPSSVARILAGGKTNTVAVITPSIFAHFAVMAMRGIETELIKTDYDFLIYTTSKFALGKFPVKDKKEFIHISEIFKKIILEKKADGVISISINIYNQKVVDFYKKNKFPIVFIEGKEKWGHRVTVDNIEGTYLATKYLLEKGKKRIGLVTGRIELIESQKDRLKGYKKALQEGGKEFNKNLFYQITSHEKEESNRILEYMQKQKVDAIMCAAGDWFATGIIKSAREKKIKIPDDIAIIGYDDLDFAGHFGLTTVKQPIIEMGQEAFKLIMEAIKNKNIEQRHIQLKPELIKRDSA